MKIDKNIPMPAVRSKNIKYPFHEMTKGDSFFVSDVPNERTLRNRISLISSDGFRFVCRKVIENDVSGYRIWRIE